MLCFFYFFFFFFNDTATTEIYTLSLHDALPIYRLPGLRLLAVGPRGHGELARDGRDGQVDVADLVLRHGVRRGRAAVQHDGDEHVRHRAVGDRDAQALAVRRERRDRARDDLPALDRDE